MEKNKTAVEWLWDILTTTYWDYKTLEEQKEIIEQAKQIQKVNDLELIAFVRLQDKMGKSIKDLYEQYYQK